MDRPRRVERSTSGRARLLAVPMLCAAVACSTSSREPPDRAGAIVDIAGIVLDVSGTRSLQLEPSGGTTVLRIVDAATRTAVGVASSPGLDLRFGDGFLTPSGAIWAWSRGPGAPGHAYEWRGGERVDLGAYGSNLTVEGAFAAWSESATTIVRRDLAAGASASLPGSDLHLGPNGDLVFEDAGCVKRYRSGSATVVACGSSWGDGRVGGFTDVRAGPTDGDGFLFVTASTHYDLSDPRFGNYWSDALTYVDASGVSHDLTYLSCFFDWQPCGDCLRGSIRQCPYVTRQIANGWVAYTEYEKSGIRLRHAGADAQLTTSGSIEALGGDGTVLVLDAGVRYRARAGAAPVAVGAPTGNPIFRDGRFLVLDGGLARELPR